MSSAHNWLLTGASGMVGQALLAALPALGYRLTALSRRPDLSRYRDVEGAIHLAGENIASGRWNADKRRRILESRVTTTEDLSRQLAQLQPRPKTLIVASAIGYYGDCDDHWVDEEAPAGEGFLPEVCKAWEAAAAPAREAGIRVVHLRFGVILSEKGGMLPRLLPPFRLGLGGRLGDGRQQMSWIDIDDVVGAVEFVARTPAIAGPVNCVAPQPVTNAEFTRTLGTLLHRPTPFTLPKPLLTFLLGDMARELFFTSCRGLPARLTAAGYNFRYPTLVESLSERLSRR